MCGCASRESSATYAVPASWCDASMTLIAAGRQVRRRDVRPRLAAVARDVDEAGARAGPDHAARRRGESASDCDRSARRRARRRRCRRPAPAGIGAPGGAARSGLIARQVCAAIVRREHVLRRHVQRLRVLARTRAAARRRSDRRPSADRARRPVRSCDRSGAARDTSPACTCSACRADRRSGSRSRIRRPGYQSFGRISPKSLRLATHAVPESCCGPQT